MRCRFNKMDLHRCFFETIEFSDYLLYNIYTSYGEKKLFFFLTLSCKY